MSAGILGIIRFRKKTPAPPGQGLFDMLGIWTTIELLLIAMASMEQSTFASVNIKLPDPAELIRSNGILFPIALIYCAILVAKSTFLSSIAAFSSEEKEGGS